MDLASYDVVPELYRALESLTKSADIPLDRDDTAWRPEMRSVPSRWSGYGWRRDKTKITFTRSGHDVPEESREHMDLEAFVHGYVRGYRHAIGIPVDLVP